MVDYTIATQVRPFQMPDVGQIYGQAQTLQANRMRMAEAQETAQERNALRGLLSSGVDINTPEGLSQLRRVAPMLAPQFEQAASQRAYQTAQAGRLRAQTQADQIKTARDLLSGVSNQAQWDAWRRSTVAALPEYADAIPTQFSPQNVQRVAEGADGIIRRATEAATAGRPNEFERALLGAGIRPGSPEWQEAMRGRATSLTGGRAPREQAFIGPDGRPLIVNLDTGVFRLAQETPMAAAPGAAQPAAPNAMLAPLAAAAPAPAAAAPPAAEAPPVDLRRPAPPAVAPAAAPTTFADMQAAQLARQLAQRRGEQAVTQEGAPARAAEAGETAEAQARGRATVEREEREQNRQRGRESIESVLNDMVTSYRRLDELSGIPSERRSRLTNVPAYLAGTAPGQEVGMAMATQSQTQRNQIQASVRQLLTAIKNATGMSAQEMNSNVELQQLLAAVSNPRQSIESVRGILTSISRQYGLGQLDFPEPTATPPPAAPRDPTPGPRRGAAPAPGTTPTLEQFLAAARRANPNVSDDALTAYYNRTYGGR
jgi:hypothetical protein